MRNNAMRAATMWTIHCLGVFGLLRLSTRHNSIARIGPTMTVVGPDAFFSSVEQGRRVFALTR